jgi:hypothetical protein
VGWYLGGLVGDGKHAGPVQVPEGITGNRVNTRSRTGLQLGAALGLDRHLRRGAGDVLRSTKHRKAVEVHIPGERLWLLRKRDVGRL